MLVVIISFVEMRTTHKTKTSKRNPIIEFGARRRVKA